MGKPRGDPRTATWDQGGGKLKKKVQAKEKTESHISNEFNTKQHGSADSEQNHISVGTQLMFIWK